MAWPPAQEGLPWRRRAAREGVETEVADLLDAQRVALTGSWTRDVVTGHGYRSPEYLRLFGLSAEQAADTEVIFSRIDGHDRERVRAALDRLIEHGDELDETYGISLPDGTRRMIEARGHRELNPRTGDLRAVGTVQDVTERHRTAAALAAAEARFRAAFENAPIGIAIVALRGPQRGHVVQANPALAQMIGRDPGELDGVAIASFTHPDDIERTAEAFQRLGLDLTTTIEKRYLHRDGSAVWALVSTTPIPGVEGAEAENAVTQVLDITDRKQFEGQLQYLADHDKLTGLYNRQRFETELQRVVEESMRYDRPGALLILDLDGFKSVNDRFGHSAGDELVRRVATVMHQSIRDTDILARIGGDEFALILQECDRGAAERVAELILTAIRRRGMIVAEGQTARVTTSVGITVFDAGSRPSPAELVVEADIAMYDAKGEGKDRYSVYDRDANRRAVVSEHHSWLDRLRRAIEEDRFVLHAQPIVGISGGGIPRYELLLRLPDERGELIPPSAFLYNAERFGLMGEIDRWVLRRAVRLLHDHAAAGNDIVLAVNLSGSTMNDLRLPVDLDAMLRECPIPDGRLVIEVTETAAIVNIERARDLARELRLLGCRFALDDFGSGFASFYYLKHLDFDYLKIDGEFIRRLPTDPTDQLVVRAVVDIASGLRTETIAEFVGDDRTVELLRQLGVSYGQGYHLGRPLPLEEVLPRLSPASGA